MKKLGNTEAELKKRVPYKKSVHCTNRPFLRTAEDKNWEPNNIFAFFVIYYLIVKICKIIDNKKLKKNKKITSHITEQI